MAFVVSSGSVTSISRAISPALPFALRLSENYYADYAEIWKRQPAVRTTIGFLARNVASLGLHAFRRLSGTDRERLTDHPLADLLSRPNPLTTRYRLISAMVHDRCIYDVAYWMKVTVDDGGSTARALVRIPPWMVTPKGGSWVGPEYFEVRGNTAKRDVPAEQMVYFRGYRPEDDMTGCSPMEALRRILGEDYEAGRYREQTLRNGARMSGYIERPQGVQWSDGAKDKFRAQWRAQYTGDGPAAGGTPILEDGMKFVAASQTAEQLQYVETRKLTREEVAVQYFIPPPMVGLLDHATFSNIDTQHRMLYQDTLGPMLADIEQELGLQLIPDLPDTSQVYVEFNLAEKLKGSFEEQARSLQTAVGAPWMTRNEGRARQNLPSIEGGDELITPLNVLEGGLASPTDTAPDEAATGPKALGPGSAPQRKASTSSLAKARAEQHEEPLAELLRKFFRRQGETVKSRRGARKSAQHGAKAWDQDRWDRELSSDLNGAAGPIVTAAATATLADLDEDPGQFDAEQTAAYLEAMSAGVAHGINTATADQLDAAGDDEDAVARVFELAAAVRAAQIASSLVSRLSGFGSVEAVNQIGATATKTWRTGRNPRPEHAAIDGETVKTWETFSNGLRWPGDRSSDANDSAGCNCSISISITS